MLTGDSRKLGNALFDDLLIGAGFAKTHIENDLDELRAFHDGLVTEFLHHLGDDGLLVVGLKTGDVLSFGSALRMGLLDGHAVFLFFSHFPSPYLISVPLFFAIRTFLPSTVL